MLLETLVLLEQVGLFREVLLLKETLLLEKCALVHDHLNAAAYARLTGFAGRGRGGAVFLALKQKLGQQIGANLVAATFARVCALK